MIPEAIFILPCPLCGTAPKGPTRMGSRLGPDWLIVCPSCLLKLERFDDSSPHDAAAQIIEAWNRRTGPTLGADVSAIQCERI